MFDRFSVLRNADQLEKIWGPTDFAYPVLRGGNFKPGSRVGVIIDTPLGLRYGHMLFGLSNHPGKPQTPFVEDHLCVEGQTYHSMFKARRCLIPVDAWYFHQRDRNTVKHFMFRSNQKTNLAMAAVYISARNKQDGMRTNTCGIVSMPASRLVDGFAGLMPGLFIGGDDYAKNYLNTKLPWDWAMKDMRLFPHDILEVVPCSESEGGGED